MRKLSIFIVLIIAFSSCKKLIEIAPPGSSLLTANVFTDSVTVQSTLAGLYLQSLYRAETSMYPALSADEFQYVGTTYDAFINDALLSTTANVNTIWNNSYTNIYYANSIIEGVTASTGLTASVKTKAIAEARFMRAYAYFYLVNFFGDVPLILTTDVNQNSAKGRTDTADVYASMVDDLKFAQANLPADYSMSAGARTRANKWIATAMLARVELYLNNWADAETQATAVINTTSLFNLQADLTKVFTPTSQEAIWQIYNDATGYTWYANLILPNPVAKVPTFVLTPSLTAAFETGDARKTAWTSTLLYNDSTYTYPAKYKSLTIGANTEYFTPIRLAEMYLIRAEARTQQNNTGDAQADVSVIRNRAGLSNTTASDKASLLLAIEQERRIELSYECGHRWFDLKRTGRVNAVIGALKPQFWQPTAALYPIPTQQLSANANLKQNPGYNN
jgi:starch-binding outer membrane protein, SusD/RagB family